MPRVPTYDNLQAAQSGLPSTTVRAPSMPDTAGPQTQQLAQGIGALGSAAGKIALDMQTDLNKTRVDDAMTRLVKVRTDLQVEALQLRGRNALERPDGKPLSEEYSTKLDEQARQLADGLGNDAQKRAFEAQAATARSQLYGALSSHMVAQQTEFKRETLAAGLETAQVQGAMLWGDEAMRKQSIGAITAIVSDQAASEGWDPAKREVELRKALSPMHAGVLRGMLSAGSVDAAQAYYDEHSTTMTLQARTMAHDMLKGQAALVRAQTFADDVMARGLSLNDALAAARTKFSGEDEKSAVSEITQRFAQRDAGRAQLARDVSRQAWSSLMSGGGMGSISPDVMAALRREAPEEERQMRDWLDAKWRRAKADAEGKFESDKGTYYGLRRMSWEEPEKFARLDLMRSQPYLSERQMDTLITLQGSIAKGDAKAMETERTLKTALSSIKSEIAAIGIDMSPKEGSPQAKETAKFMGALTQALDDATRAKGAPLTYEESKRIGMSMVQEGVQQGSGLFGMFQTKKRGYQIATDPDATGNFVVKRFGDIPIDVRNALAVEYRKSKGLGTRPLSGEDEAAIERAYTRGVQQGRFK